MKLLNDSLYETAHLLQIGNIHSPGTDHGYLGMRITPDMLAANMFDRIKLIIPESNGISNYSFPGSHVANLLMAIIYESDELKEKSLVLAEKGLNKKIPNYIKSWIRCMRAILLKDCNQINEQLMEFCKNFTRCNDYGANGFNKRFCIEAHGMYNLALWAYNGELRKDIAMPTAFNFCQDLAIYQAEHDYMPGEVYYTYPKEYDIYNKLMRCEPPILRLKGEGKKRILDVNRFADDVINNLDKV